MSDCETQENYGDKESVISVDTTALLHRLLPNTSPLSEVQVTDWKLMLMLLAVNLCS